MLSKLQQRNKGFTIVEVMIVLAIGGMIMLIVFLAVPALQRNSRNNQRTADASRTSAAVNECLANTNGTVASCDQFVANELLEYIDIAANSQLTTEAAADPGAGVTNQFNIDWNERCNQAGTTSGAGGGAKSFTIVYRVETRSGDTPRCIGS